MHNTIHVVNVDTSPTCDLSALFVLVLEHDTMTIKSVIDVYRTLKGNHNINYHIMADS